jgi:hypothetical protein
MSTAAVRVISAAMIAKLNQAQQQQRHQETPGAVFARACSGA